MIITCHGQEDDYHEPDQLVKVDSDTPGLANVMCPTCGTIMETNETTATVVAQS